MKAVNNVEVGISEEGLNHSFQPNGTASANGERLHSDFSSITSSPDYASLSKQDQFMRLYNPAHERLSRFVHSMVWHREDAKDIISETVLKAYEKFEDLKKPESFLYFLFGIASRLSKRRGRRIRLWLPFNNEQAENIIDHSSDAARRAEIDLLYKAMAKLPEKQREAVSLFDISGFSLAEIQEIQGCSLSGVKSRISRGRQSLARILNKQYSEDFIPFAQSYETKKLINI